MLENDIFVSCVYLDPRINVLLSEKNKDNAKKHKEVYTSFNNCIRHPDINASRQLVVKNDPCYPNQIPHLESLKQSYFPEIRCHMLLQDMPVKLSTLGIRVQVQVTGWCGHGIEAFDSRM